MSLERPNLAGAFIKQPPVDRAATLAGLLPPTRPTTTKPVESPSDEGDAPARAPLSAVQTTSPPIDARPPRGSPSPSRQTSSPTSRSTSNPTSSNSPGIAGAAPG